MTASQILIFAVLAATMALFLWERWRHDVVALLALMACVVLGLVPADAAFAGFGHPAVITVACVLVLSLGLQQTGVIDWLARKVLPRDAGRLSSIAALLGLGAFLSGFMNNVGAMALLMPVAVQLARRLDLEPGQVLMPLAFGTILGGMTTLIGTPPNLIVSGFRAEAGLGQFAMLDFAPVGASVAVLGVAFVALAGWRLVPARKATGAEGFDTGTYLTEVRVPKGSKAIGLSLRAFEDEIEDNASQVLGLIRNDVRLVAPHGGRHIRAGDILVLEANVETLAKALTVFGIRLEGQGASSERKDVAQTVHDAPDLQLSGDDDDESDKRDEDIILRELAVLPGSSIVGLSASDLRLRTRYGLNLLAVSREGSPPKERLRTLDLKSGDLLLM